jgi:hypothetical protein
VLAQRNASTPRLGMRYAALTHPTKEFGFN